VVIEVRGGSTPVRRRATSGPDGRFVIRPLYDGDYRLFARSGPLKLLAAKWKVSQATVEPFAFAIEQGRDLQRDLTVHVQP
jgi:hypothetical protein